MWKNPALKPNMQLNNIKQMIKTMQMTQNPQAALQSMLAQNPKLVQAMSLVKSMGTDPKTAFYNLASQNGVDADALIKELMN